MFSITYLRSQSQICSNLFQKLGAGAAGFASRHRFARCEE
jgi:hypothetical protein